MVFNLLFYSYNVPKFNYHILQYLSNRILSESMTHQITDKVLALAGAAGSLVASIFLSPPKYVWGVSGLVIAATSLGLFLQNRWV
jgi:hypothetical protein